MPSKVKATRWLEDFIYLCGSADRADVVWAARMAGVPWSEVLAALAANPQIVVERDCATPHGGDIWVWKGGLRP